MEREELYKAIQVELDPKEEMYQDLIEPPPRKALEKKKKKEILPIIEPVETIPIRQSTSSEVIVSPIPSSQKKKKKKKKETDEIETHKKRKRPPELESDKQKKKKEKKKKKENEKKEIKKETKKEVPPQSEKKPILIELPWKHAEDIALRKAGQLVGTGNWDIICDVVNSSLFPTATPRTPAQCRNRFIRLAHGSSEEKIEQSLMDISTEVRRKNLEKAMQIWYAKKSASRKSHEDKKKPQKPKPFAVASSVQNPIDFMYAFKKLVESTPVFENRNIISKLPPRFQTGVRPAIPAHVRYPPQTKISVTPTTPTMGTSKEIPPTNLILTPPNAAGMSSVVLSSAGNQATGIAHINQMMAARTPLGMAVPQQPQIQQPQLQQPNQLLPKTNPDTKKISISQTGPPHPPVGYTIMNNPQTAPTLFAPTTQIISSPVKQQPVPQQTYPQQPFGRIPPGSWSNYLGMYIINKQPTKAPEITRILQRTDIPEQKKVELLSEILGQQSQQPQVQQIPQMQTPIQSQTIQTQPIQSQTIQSQPIQSQPMQSQTIQSTPIQSPSIQSTTIATTPIQSPPIQSPQQISVQQSPQSMEKKARTRKTKKKL